tara:strand:+ start:1381 stop:2112 length:732 start_codon:yes stop_codon:yes gene_type:complete
MRNIILGMSALALAAVSAPAFAQEEASDGFTVSGSVALVSDYRFRGVSLSGEEAAVQGAVTVGHESGLYAGFWGSSTTAQFGTEIDAIVGYSTKLGGVTVDGGVTYYLYPNDSSAATDYFEPYLSVSGDVGPANLKVGAAYAFEGQNALFDNSIFYVFTDAKLAIPSTPLTAKAHLGYSKSDNFVVPGVSNDDYIDYSVGVEASWKSLTFGVSYVNTDITKAFGAKEALGADGAVLFTVGAAF